MSIMTNDYHNTKIMVENCIETMDYKVVFWYSIVLAIGNAVDSIGIIYVSYILSTLNNVLTSIEKEWIAASIFIGMFIGGLIGGKLADIYGRRFYLLASYIITLIGFLCTYISSLFVNESVINASNNINNLILSCILCGIGIGSFIPIIFSLGSELFPSKYRGKLLAIVASFWMVGSVYTALIGWTLLGNDIYGNKIMTPEDGGNWHIFILLCSVPVCLGLVLTYMYIPESPTFILNKTYSHIHLSNDQKLHEMSKYLVLVNAQGWNMQLNSNSEPEAIASKSRNNSEHHRKGFGTSTGTGIGVEPSSPMHGNNNHSISVGIGQGSSTTGTYRDDKLYSGLSLTDINTAHNGRDGQDLSMGYSMRSTATVATTNNNLWYLSIVWFTLNFASSGILLWVNILYDHIDIHNIYGTSFIYALASLPGAIYGYYYIDRLGRYMMLYGGMMVSALSIVGMMISIACYYQFQANTTSIGAIIATLFLIISSVVFSAATVVSWNAVETLSVESFPSSIRPTSVGILTAWARVGAIVAQFVFGELEHHILILLCCTCIALLIGAMCGRYVPDTTGVLLVAHSDELSQISLGDLNCANMSMNDDNNGGQTGNGTGNGTVIKSVVIGDEIDEIDVEKNMNMDIPLVVNQSQSQSHRNNESLVSMGSMFSNASVAI